MASLRSKATTKTVGSTEWIQTERQQLSQFYEQEQEDFVFSVRNETEWLNEHMADILSNTQINVAEIFKTPGKLRGKTPRTVRRGSPERPPLTEIFSADKRYNQSPSRVQIAAKDTKISNPVRDHVPIEEQFPPIDNASRLQKDSGYHGSTGDEMDVDEPQHKATDVPEEVIEQLQAQAAVIRRVSAEDRTTTENSFHSANENPTTREVVMMDVTDQQSQVPQSIPGAFPKEPSLPPMPREELSKHEMSGERPAPIVEETLEIQQSPHSSSVGSSPAKPLMRKSSLTFATLPAREPLGTKKSIGNQASIIGNTDGSRGPINRSSYMGRYTGGKSLGGAKPADNDEMEIDVQEPETLIHNKDSTQRLHDRIDLLGKTQPGRSNKSGTIATNVWPTYPDLPAEVVQEESTERKEKKEVKSVKIIDAEPSVPDKDDLVMSSISKQNAPERPNLTKSRSVDVMEYIAGKENISGTDFGIVPSEKEIMKMQSPLRSHPVNGGNSPLPRVNTKAASTVDLSTTTFQPIGPQKPISVSNPNLPPPAVSTTPAGSPIASRFHLDGHLSASKHKLQSIMKSARGLFSSSARVSNQAKMETMSPSAMKMRNAPSQPGLQEINEVPMFDQPKYPDITQAEPESSPKGRKTRSSTEKERELKKSEKEAKEREKQESDLAKAREQERIKVAKFQEKHKTAPSTASLISKISSLEQTSRPIRSSPRRIPALDKPLPPIDSTVEATAAPSRVGSQLIQPSKPMQAPRRPARPAATATKDNTLPRAKQPPVSIRIGPLSSRAPVAGPSSQEETAPSVPAKAAAPVKKASTASQQTNASTASLKGSVTSNSSRARAPIARKIERKPTAQELAQQRIAERTAAAEEAKKAAYKQAAEKKNMMAKEQQTLVSGTRVASGNAKSKQSRSVQKPTNSTMKPLPKVNGKTEFPRPPTANGTNKGKRVLEDTDDEAPESSRSGTAQNYQQTEAKRRRTGDEEVVEPPVVRSAMAAPPMRPSMVRKDPLKSSMFSGNYPHAPPPAAIHAGSSRPVVQPLPGAQIMPQPVRAVPDMAKFADGRIPFANQPNPPQHPAPFKTPLHKQTNMLQPPSTFSPMFPNPENIHLADIETSEDDDDSEDERERKRNMPDWTATPNMNAILLQQETIDTDAVFGAIAPPNLEEWFPKDKNRLQKLRARTSSANWFGADRLTEDEVKKDLEARQKMSKDGGWSMGLARLNE